MTAEPTAAPAAGTVPTVSATGAVPVVAAAAQAFAAPLPHQGNEPKGQAR